MKRILPSMAIGICAAACLAGVRTVRMLPGEGWWGLGNDFGRQMPFTEATSFSCDLRENNYAHQAQSLLVSDKGRAIWCDEPVKAVIKGGEIALASDAGEIALVEAGATSRAVVVPPGTWKTDDGTVVEGPTTVTVAAPLARLPHFVRLADAGRR